MNRVFMLELHMHDIFLLFTLKIETHLGVTKFLFLNLYLLIIKIWEYVFNFENSHFLYVCNAYISNIYNLILRSKHI